MVSVEPANLLVITADEHRREVCGAYGNGLARTPALDSLAAMGTRFQNAYCTSPICVPSRASFVTGLYPHELGAWDNSAPYTGAEARSWGHAASSAGYDVATVGKLHFRDANDDTGFPNQFMPMHVHNGTGNLTGLLRADRPVSDSGRELVLGAGAGETETTRYDRKVADFAVEWLKSRRDNHKPWILWVSFVSPHFPLVAPERYYDMYADVELPSPIDADARALSEGPLGFGWRARGFDKKLDDADVDRAIRGYYGLVSFVDSRIGLILEALAASNLADTTRIIYTSDHGEMLGDHGIWQKDCMYEGAVGVPLIIAGPDVPSGEVVHDNLSLIDGFPSVLDAIGAPDRRPDAQRHGASWWHVGTIPERSVFSEYHGGWSESAIYMMKRGSHKYVHSVGFEPMLFDLSCDPLELTDVSKERDYAASFRRLQEELRMFIDPEQVDVDAKASQRRRVAGAGGPERLRARGDAFLYTPIPSVAKG